MTNSIRLLLDLTKRDLQSRYISSAVGALWLVAYPTAICAVFVLFFDTVAGTRGGSGQVANPAIFIICGFIPFQFWSEALNRSPGAILAVPHLVKKIVFPVEMVCYSLVLAASVQLLINIILLTAISIIMFDVEPNFMMLVVPIVLLPLILFVTAFCLIFAASGVYFRDLLQIVTLVTTASMFFGPVFYDVDTVSGIVRFFLQVNPLTQPIEDLRNIFLLGGGPDFVRICISLAAALVFFLGALAYFRSLKDEFADVL